MELTKILNINIETLHKRNKEYIKKMDINKLSDSDFGIIGIINHTQPKKKWTIYTVHLFLLNRIPPAKMLTFFGNITSTIKEIKQFIISLDELMARASIKMRGPLYRCMIEPYANNEILNYSHWALLPDFEFCEFNLNRIGAKRFWVYILKGNCTGLYINRGPETNESKYFRSRHDFQVILPRGLKFKIIKTETIKVLNFDYIYFKDLWPDKINKWLYIIVNYITPV